MAAHVTAKDLLAKKKPVTRTVTIVLDGELADRWNEAKAALDEAKAADDRASTEVTRLKLADAEAALEELQPSVKDATIEMTLQSLGRRGYQGLIELHPPTKVQKEKARKRGNNDLDNNPDSFPPALIAASLVDPKMTEEDVAELFASEQFNEIELAELYGAALMVNTTSKVIDLKGVSGPTLD